MFSALQKKFERFSSMVSAYHLQTFLDKHFKVEDLSEDSFDWSIKSPISDQDWKDFLKKTSTSLKMGAELHRFNPEFSFKFGSLLKYKSRFEGGGYTPFEALLGAFNSLPDGEQKLKELLGSFPKKRHTQLLNEAFYYAQSASQASFLLDQGADWTFGAKNLWTWDNGYCPTHLRPYLTQALDQGILNPPTVIEAWSQSFYKFHPTFLLNLAWNRGEDLTKTVEGMTAFERALHTLEQFIKQDSTDFVDFECTLEAIAWCLDHHLPLEKDGTIFPSVSRLIDGSNEFINKMDLNQAKFYKSTLTLPSSTLEVEEMWGNMKSRLRAQCEKIHMSLSLDKPENTKKSMRS